MVGGDLCLLARFAGVAVLWFWLRLLVGCGRFVISLLHIGLIVCDLVWFVLYCSFGRFVLVFVRVGLLVRV